MIFSKILVLICLVFIYSCIASPRYSSSSSSKANYPKKVKDNSWDKSKNKPDNQSKSSFRKKDHKLKGVSSWYGPNFHGKLTANGEVFDQYGVTAAHKTLPLGTVVRVTNLGNNKSIILRINDRGPYVNKRVLDCSYGAAIKLGFKDIGTADVKIEIIEVGDGVYMHHTNN